MAIHTPGNKRPIRHDSAPLVQWQSGRCSLTNQASPGQAPGEPFGGDPFPLPVFLPGMEGTDEHRTSIIVVHYTRGKTTCQGQNAKLLNFLSVKKNRQDEPAPSRRLAVKFYGLRCNHRPQRS